MAIGLKLVRNNRGSKKGNKKGNKKGFTYLLVTSFLIVVILGIFFATDAYRYQDRESSQQVRIRAMNDFVINLNEDIHRATYISAFRSLLALEDNVATSGEYLTNINSSFSETFFNGTINKTDAVIMENSSFSKYILKIKDIAADTGFNVDMNVTNIHLVQTDPWSVQVHILLAINISDSKNLASWNISNEYITSIPIDNLRDPLYSKNTLNRVPNSIRHLNTTMLTNTTDTTNLQYIIANSYYVASPYAPNFLMRFEGRTSPDPNGIESIVNIQSLSDQEIVVDENRVKVDYIYFNNLPSDKVCNVQNIPSIYYFVIPSNRTALYQVAGLNYSNICP